MNNDEQQKPVITDVAHPTVGTPPPGANQQQPQNPVSKSDEAPLDTKTQAPVVASKDDSNMKLTITIVLAVLVSLALIGFAYMAFLQQTGEEETVPTESSQTQSTQEEAVNASTIDQETAEIDGIINELDDTADLPEDELSNSNLGL